ncbi:MAG: methyltransferase domain-containing protein [Erysipelotrichaceae bacterium]|nr:methyltransferase domain-containing protein [Erysipelotrichaceae bacterium]
MEGSADSRNVSNYEVLAKYYDELLQDEEALSLWLQYIEEKEFKSVLELASGSGVMAGILKRKGYEIIASDLSKQMKEASKSNYDGEYLILNMTDYNLSKKFDLVLCICDSINYLYEEELDDFFKCAYKHLNDNGRLIFDMHHMKRIEEFKDQYIEEGFVSNVPYQWTIQSDEYDHSISEHFTFYTSEGMIQENHFQNVFDPKVIKEKMDKYFDVRIIEDFAEEEKILVVGVKK